MPKVTYATLESAAYDSIYALVNNRSLVVDPRDPSGYHKRVFIYDADPLMKGLNTGDLPYIVLELPTVKQGNVSFDNNHADVYWTMKITVRTAREGSNGASNGRSDMLSICDDLQELFNSDTQQQALRLFYINFAMLTKDGVSTPVIDEKYLYEAEYTLEFRTRMVVSA